MCANFCFAKQIQLQIVQHDDRTDTVTEDSLVIEDELLAGFFETGYIITNSPAVVSSSASDDVTWPSPRYPVHRRTLELSLI